jgi:hypothetical protein
MTTRNNFKQFSNTTFYTNFHDCLQYNNDTITVNTVNQYTNNLDFLYNTFSVKSTPSDEEMDEYIYTFETIENDDVNDFKKFILIVFERSIDATYTCNEVLKNYNTKIVKLDTNCKIIDNIQSIKDDKKQERDNKKKIKRDLLEQEHEIQRQTKLELRLMDKQLRKLNKEREIKEQYIYNNTLIKCFCGLDYIRRVKSYHKISKEHKYRMDAIKYVLDPEIYKQYLNKTIVDDTSDSSSILDDDDDLSSISSKSI